MAGIKYPFEFFDLERACAFFEQHDIDCYVDDFIGLWCDNKISLCYYFKSDIKATDRKGNIECVNGIVYPEYKQIMGFINGDYSVVDMPLRVKNAKGNSYYIDYEHLMLYSEGYGDYLNFRPKEDLCISDDEMSKVYAIFTGEDAIKIHKNAERNAQQRERLYMQAIRVLVDHPDECKGERGELTQSAWAKAIIAHFPDYGYPGINNEETIVRLLRGAMHITNERK